MCGLGRSPNNSLMVACGDGVVVAAAHNAAAADGVAAMHNAAVVDDVAAANVVAAIDDVAAMNVVSIVVGAVTAVDV